LQEESSSLVGCDDLETTDNFLNEQGYRAVDDTDINVVDKTRLHGGLVRASEKNETAVCAFDNKGMATKWLAFLLFINMEEFKNSQRPWLEYRLPADRPPVKLKKYTLTSANDFPERDPSHIKVECWDDSNRKWTVLDEQDNIIFPERGHQLEFEVAPSNNHVSRRFRLHILNVRDPQRASDRVQLSGWHLYSVINSGAKRPIGKRKLNEPEFER
jgi:hypothetical protein